MDVPTRGAAVFQPGPKPLLRPLPSQHCATPQTVTQTLAEIIVLFEGHACVLRGEEENGELKRRGVRGKDPEQEAQYTQRLLGGKMHRRFLSRSVRVGATLVIRVCGHKATPSLAGKCDTAKRSLTGQPLGPAVRTSDCVGTDRDSPATPPQVKPAFSRVPV